VKTRLPAQVFQTIAALGGRLLPGQSYF
jgi:hypothetical protein